MTTVTLGPSGTYSHRAARAVSDGDVSFRESVTSIVEAVASGDATRGVVPIENSIEGSVTETLDALADYDVAVVREVEAVRDALDLPSRLRDVDGPEPEGFQATAEATVADAFVANAPADLDFTTADAEAILDAAW